MTRGDGHSALKAERAERGVDGGSGSGGMSTSGFWGLYFLLFGVGVALAVLFQNPIPAIIGIVAAFVIDFMGWGSLSE